jgi:uncharacterized membrane protein YeiH
MPLTLAMDAARPVLQVLDMAAVGVFAISGALAAARARQTIVTFAFFAAVTGIGGGTLRDLLIDAPVFWVGRSDYLAVCLAAALLVWVLRADRWKMAALLWFDALGMAAYAVVGSAKALSYGLPPLPSFVMGVLTASFGGIIRDVLAGVPSVLLGREIYVSAAALGAAVHVGGVTLGLDPVAAGLLGFAAGFILRALAISRGLSIPHYRGRD